MGRKMSEAGALCLAGFLSILLVGCGETERLESAFEPTPKETTVITNALEAKSEVVSLYRAMHDLLGGDWVDDTHTWAWCRGTDGKDGVSYKLFSLRADQPLPADAKRVAEQARAIWAQFGHPVDIEYDNAKTRPRHILSDPPLLAGSKPNGLLVQFTVGKNYADFTATSRCVLGDEEQLNLLEE